VAAVVDGVPVPSTTVEHLSDQYISAPPPTDPNTGDTVEPLPRKEVRQLVLQYAIRLAYLEKIARDRKITASPNPLLEEVLKVASSQDFAGTGWTADDLRTGEFAGNLSKALAEQLFPKVAVAESDIREKYDSEKDTFQASWKASVRAAYFSNKEAADQLRQRVADKKPFDETARQLGGSQVGSMGTVSSSDALPPNVLGAIGALRPGQPSAPIEASGGWVVFYVDNRQDSPARTYQQVRAQLRQTLEDQKRQTMFSDWFDQQLKSAPVHVDSFYGSWNSNLAAIT
jgi:parvulin-like peptidyl-prolyl isomerase